MVRSAHKALKVTENGSLRWYAASMAGGAVLVLGIIVLG
jgi:NADH-quinone oxidoreductase subunit L